MPEGSAVGRGTLLGLLAASGDRGPWQTTLRRSSSCQGFGLHGGQPARLTIRPAPIGHGIVFRRTDRPGSLAARYDLVAETRLCTLLASRKDPTLRVGTIEHLMAALAATGIDNALIDIDGPEVPIMDGSSSPFLALITRAGLASQSAVRRTIEVRRTVRVSEGEGFAQISPGPGFSLDVSIDFEAPAIGRQSLSLERLDAGRFGRELADARTFALAHEIDGLRAAGLARGGSLDNAVVVDGATVLNPGGLRRPDEFVRHKMLDVVGDLALAGHPIAGRFTGHRCGHGLNNRVLRALFASQANWALVDSPVEVRAVVRAA